MKIREDIKDAGGALNTRAGFRAEAQGRGDFLITAESRGRREEEQPKVVPKGEGVGTSESNNTDGHRYQRNQQGDARKAFAGTSDPDSLTCKLADSPVSESLIRPADGPAGALDAGLSTLDSKAPATSYALPATLAKPIVFGCYGAARWEKGSDIFQEAIKRILKNEVSSAKDKAEIVTREQFPDTSEGRPQRFAIQWVEDFRDREGNLVSIDLWLQGHPQVEVIGRFFEGDEYEQRLAQTDVMVLPYRSPYRLRVSRVVIEAMLNGMPVIATRGTTLFEQAEEYGVVVGCEEGDAESLAEAMLEVAARFGMLRASAEEKVNAAAESFSVAYFRELLGKPVIAPLDAKAYL